MALFPCTARPERSCCIARRWRSIGLNRSAGEAGRSSERRWTSRSNTARSWSATCGRRSDPRARASLPASRASRGRRRDLFRGAAATDAPRARRHRAWRLHSHSRGIRADPCPWRMGIALGMPGGEGMAGGDLGGGERVDLPGARRGPACPDRACFGRDGVVAQQLELEMTEYWLMEDAERARASLSELRAMGICLALDDSARAIQVQAIRSRFRSTRSRSTNPSSLARR